MIIFGIETSCDETSVGICQDGKILRQWTYSQVARHSAFGGIVPEIASREHTTKLPQLLKQALQTATPDVVAVTSQPGLLGSLLVGVTAAKTLALTRNIPLVSVDHLNAHHWSPMIEHELKFPYISVLLSGGHSQIALINDLGTPKILSTTVDDAAGEAFDKLASLLGFPYPGAQHVDQTADLTTDLLPDIPVAFRTNPQQLNMSFSGLKTAARGWKTQRIPAPVICRSFRESVARALEQVLNRLNTKGLLPKGAPITFAGGVAANQHLRHRIEKWAHDHHRDFYSPALEFCTDNGGMIAHAGYLLAKAGRWASLLDLDAQPTQPRKSFLET